MNKLAMIGAVGVLGLGGLAVVAGGGSSFSAKVKGGKEVSVDYSALKDYVSMESGGEARQVGADHLKVPVKYAIKKAFSSVVVFNEDGAKKPTSLAGGKEGEKQTGELYLSNDLHSAEIKLGVMSLKE